MKNTILPLALILTIFIASCSKSSSPSLPPTPASISGTLTLNVATTTTLSDATTGGTWSSATTSVATITTAGVVTGIAAGTAVISYTVSNSVGSVAATATVTVSPSTQASVMFVHGCAGGSDVYPAVAGTNLTGVSSFTYLGNSGYQYVTPGSTVNLGFNQTSGAGALSSGNVNLHSSSYYSVFAGSKNTSPTFVFVADTLTAPSSGNAKIRIVNLAYDTLSVTASCGSTTIASNIINSHASNFYEVPSGTYDISIGQSTNFPSIKTLTGQTLAAGKIYTAMYSGLLSGTGSSVLKVTIINNN